MIAAREILKKGHILARPKETELVQKDYKGLHRLQLGASRDTLIYVPQNYTKEKQSPLAIMLHGAGGVAEHGLNLFRHYADHSNLILLAPASQGTTWDIIAKDSFNGDIILIDKALSIVFDTFNINPHRVAIGGFSDGASYALSLGLSNGDLFTHIIAFSPGFYRTIENKGKPSIFISHGVKDPVLPIAPCSRRIVPRLKRLGYNMEYKEFDGAHEIPAEVSAGAVEWFLED
jgi:phospholipase/carboxylesterase